MTATTHHTATGVGRPAATTSDVTLAPTVSVGTSRALALLRIGLGLVFLWAFLDKAFGLGYSTPTARAWVNGGAPTAGFLGNVETGPLRSVFTAMAGQPVWDWLFMVGLLGIGVALLAGVALRVAAVGGIIMMALMWLAEWPLASLTAAGEASGSSNPVVDYHVVYALALAVVALAAAFQTWGLASRWQGLTTVQRFRWLV